MMRPNLPPCEPQRLDAKARFLALMSDELRTPLNEVIGAVELLRRTAVSDRQRRCADIASTAAESLLETVSDVLDLCRIEGDDLRLERIPFDPHSVLHDVVDTVTRAEAAPSLRIVTPPDDQTPGTLRGDPARLRQILANLAHAARAFANPGTLDLHAQTLDLDASSCSIRFQIRDPSACIPPARRSRLAEEFRQVASASSQPVARVGLRLAIAARLAEMMGATIIVDDDSDAVFSLTLRLPINAAHPGNELTTHSHRLALVAVDDPVVRAILDELLRSSGVLPFHAAPGISLADVVKRHAPDLLILECPASPKDAIALVTSLRATTGLPLLLLGPAPSEGTCRLPLGTGPTELAALPLAPDEFLEKAHRLLLGTEPGTNAPGPAAPRAA